jgi:hypothetical protein
MSTYTLSQTHKKAHPRKPERTMRSDILVLLGMCAFAILVLGASFVVKWLPANTINIGSLFTPHADNRDTASFELGAVQLGTTLDHVRAQHTDIQKAITADGSITLSFFDGQDRYVVWYGEDGPQHIAYKARQVRELRGTTEDEFIGSLAERYGAPSISTCSRRVIDGVRDCQFSWWVPGEIRMDINSRQDPRDQTAALKVTTQITDTRAEGRLRRLANGN